MPASTAEPAELLALKRTLARALRTKMKAERISVTSFAKRIGTHRTAVRRILDESNTSITLLTMFKTTRALGLQLDLSTKPMSPAALGRLGEKLVQAPDTATAKSVTEALVAGFYGRAPSLPPLQRVDLPEGLLRHLLTRIREREISVTDLTGLAAWLDQIRSSPPIAGTNDFPG
jgi:hypothetical protein